MRQGMVVIVMALASVAVLVGSALGQDARATVRTRDGVSYTVSNPALEVSYTIGEAKERAAEPMGLQSSITFTSSMPSSYQPGEQAAGGGPGTEQREGKLLKGHARLTEIPVWRQGVEIRLPWSRIRSLQLARHPVSDSGLPPYVSHYRYSASFSLSGGERGDADYVSLGTAVLRGSTAVGRVDIPWEEIEYVTFER